MMYRAETSYLDLVAFVVMLLYEYELLRNYLLNM